MGQSIVTRYHGPAARGSRISATCDGGRVSIPYPHHLSTEAKHGAAVRALIEKMAHPKDTFGGWHGVWIMGRLPNDKGNVYVRLDGSFSREWCDKYLFGVEGEDWIYSQGKGA